MYLKYFQVRPKRRLKPTTKTREHFVGTANNHDIEMRVQRPHRCVVLNLVTARHNRTDELTKREYGIEKWIVNKGNTPYVVIHRVGPAAGLIGWTAAT